MTARTFSERCRARAAALRYEGAQHMNAFDKTKEGSHEHKMHGKRIVELAPIVAMLDVFSRPPSGDKR
jgi:hypothetical protein